MAETIGIDSAPLLRTHKHEVEGGTIGPGDIADNAVTNAKLAQMTAYTVKANNTGSTADPQDIARTVLVASTIVSTSDKTTPDNTDVIGIVEGSTLKRVSWTNTKATLKTYFDTLYQPDSISLDSLAALSYVSTSFVKMTAANTFALDTNVYITAAGSITGSANSLKSPATTGLAQLTGMGAGVTRVYTVPNADATLIYSGGALGTPASGNLTNCTFPTLNQNTTGTAAVATAVTCTDESSDTTCFPLFATAATGNNGAKTAAGLTFDSDTDTLFSTGLTGSAASFGEHNLTSSIALRILKTYPGTDVKCLYTEHNFYITSTDAYNQAAANYFLQRFKISSGVTCTSFPRTMAIEAKRNSSALLDAGTLNQYTAQSIAYGHGVADGSAPTTGTIYGLILYPGGETGTITNLYDLYIDSMTTGGTVTNHYSIYQADTTSINYFAGAINGNLNGTVGATTPAAGAFTTLTATVADEIIAATLIGGTGLLQIVPYFDATSGCLIQSLNTAQTDYKPMTISASKFIFGVGPVGIGSLGTAALPSLYFGTDSNTGAWSPGADTYAISTGGVERLRVTDTGVGINIASPINQLQSNITSAVSAATSGSSANGNLRLSASSTSLICDFGVVGSPAYAWIQVRESGNYANNWPLVLNPNGSNVLIGGTAARETTAGSKILSLFDGTAPAGKLANGISFYSSSGEGYVMDAAGNATLLSPHDKETNEWIYRSKDTRNGKVLKIDMEKMMRFLNDHFGTEFIHEYMET